MSKKVLWKTVIEVEVLSEDPFDYNTLGDVHYAITDGGCSGIYSVKDTKHLTKEEAIKECEKQATDPDFFMLNEE